MVAIERVTNAHSTSNEIEFDEKRSNLKHDDEHSRRVFRRALEPRGRGARVTRRMRPDSSVDTPRRDVRCLRKIFLRDVGVGGKRAYVVARTFLQGRPHSLQRHLCPRCALTYTCLKISFPKYVISRERIVQSFGHRTDHAITLIRQYRSYVEDSIFKVNR